MMMNALNSSNKSDYYIGMSLPSRQSEYNPNCVVSSVTILDSDDFDAIQLRPVFEDDDDDDMKQGHHVHHSHSNPNTNNTNNTNNNINNNNSNNIPDQQHTQQPQQQYISNVNPNIQYQYQHQHQYQQHQQHQQYHHQHQQHQQHQQHHQHHSIQNQQSPKYTTSGTKKSKLRTTTKKESSSQKRKTSNNDKQQQQQQQQVMSMDNMNNNKLKPLVPSTTSHVHSPQLISPNHSHDSHNYDSHDSYSDATRGQQHKLNGIALPSSYYNSEYGGTNSSSKGATTTGTGTGGSANNILDDIPEFKFTEDNLKKHQHQHLHDHHNKNVALTNGVSTDSQAMSRIFHPGNRLQFSKFKHPESKNKGCNKLQLNPESQYSTAAAKDPLDELDNMDVLNNYDKHKELGKGADAFVYEVVDRRDKSHVAMKLTKRKSGRYKTEIHLLYQLRTCPYIVKLLNCLENDNVYVLILEHAPMSLENLLLQRCTKHPMQERVTKTIFLQILKGIKAIHNLGFVHKDIKPENVLIFANRSERKLIAKVADFGFATRVGPDASISGNITLSNLPKEKYLEFEKHVRDRCGTPGFWPPELVTNLSALKHAFKMDVFSAGVTLYRMLCNDMPFGIFTTWKYNIDHRDGQKKLCKVKPNWQVISWMQSDNKYTPVLTARKLSDIVKDLLRSMLRIRPEKRATVDASLVHEFFNKNGKPQE